MKKRVVAMFLAAGMMISCLSGCGQTGQKSSQQSEQESSVQESKSTEQSTVQEEKEIEKVTWVIRCDPQEDDQKVIDAMNEILREKYNLELNVIAIPSGEYNEKAKLMITSEEEFDLMYTASFTNNFYDNVAMGAFLPLNDLLETEAAKDLMSVYPIDIAGVATVDGSIYALPNYQSMFNQEAVYIQKDIADKYNLDYENIEYIHDVRDLEEFMIQVRDNEKDMYVLHEGNSFGAAIKAKNGIPTSTYGTVGCVAEGTLEAYFSMDDREVTLEKYDGFYWLYENGFVRSDIATVTDSSGDYKANRYAMTVTTYKPGGDAEHSVKMGEDYIMIPIGNDPYMKADAGVTTMTAVNVNSKNPEAAIKLYGVMWTDKELFNMLLFGLEGEHYTKVSDNRVELIADSGYNRSSYGWMLGNQFNAYLIPGQDDDVWTLTEEINNNARKSTFAGFVFDTTPVETELAQISSVNSEYNNRYKYTKAEEFYDDWYNKLIDAGAKTVVAELQKQLDAWAEANGKK